MAKFQIAQEVGVLQKCSSSWFFGDLGFNSDIHDRTDLLYGERS